MVFPRTRLMSQIHDEVEIGVDYSYGFREAGLSTKQLLYRTIYNNRKARSATRRLKKLKAFSAKWKWRASTWHIDTESVTNHFSHRQSWSSPTGRLNVSMGPISPLTTYRSR